MEILLTAASLMTGNNYISFPKRTLHNDGLLLQHTYSHVCCADVKKNYHFLVKNFLFLEAPPPQHECKGGT